MFIEKLFARRLQKTNYIPTNLYSLFVPPTLYHYHVYYCIMHENKEFVELEYIIETEIMMMVICRGFGMKKLESDIPYLFEQYLAKYLFTRTGRSAHPTV